MAVDGILFASRVKMSLKTLMQQIVEREREKCVGRLITKSIFDAILEHRDSIPLQAISSFKRKM